MMVIMYSKITRIIPADAGSTLHKTAPMGSVWDHPRGCGEHIAASELWDYPQGSSPRMRGARTQL